MDTRTLPSVMGHRRRRAGSMRLLSTSDPETKPNGGQPKASLFVPTTPAQSEYLSLTHDGLQQRLSEIHLPTIGGNDPNRPLTSGARPARLFERGVSAGLKRKAVLPPAANPALISSTAKEGHARRARAGLILLAALDGVHPKKKPSNPDNSKAAAVAVAHARRHGRPRMTSNTGHIYNEVFGKLDPLSLKGISNVKKQPSPAADTARAPMKGNLHHVFAGYALKGEEGSSSSSESSDDEDVYWDYAEMVTDSISRMKNAGVKIIPVQELIFGREVDSGSFGVVRRAEWVSRGRSKTVAVKTSVRDDEFDETLELFELEARMSWKAGHFKTGTETASGKDASHIVQTYGVCYDVGYSEDAPPVLHLVMELLNCDGDIHNEIHREEYWECIRDRGKDTGRAVKTQFVMTDRNDVWGYTMPRARKIEIALGLARAMRELRDSGVIHCDIKPANTVLHSTSKGEIVVKLIDFGEANILPDALGDIAGTPGYMAPEMEASGAASPASDMYSAGVYLIELWAGWIGPLFEEYNGVSSCQVAELRAMRAEIANALSRIERIDPHIAGVLRRCVSPQVDWRPSPLLLIRAIKRASAAGECGSTRTGKARRRSTKRK